MSARSFVLRSTSQSEQDYADILLYSLKTWGPGQATIYRHSLDRAIDTLLEYPHLGVTRTDIGHDYRAIQVRHHIVYYRTFENVVHLMRILHERQDARGQFDDLD